MGSNDLINEAYDDSEVVGEERESKSAWMKRWYQLLTSPLDLQLVINEKLEMINWDAYAKSLAKPLGNFLTILFFYHKTLAGQFDQAQLLQTKRQVWRFRSF